MAHGREVLYPVRYMTLRSFVAADHAGTTTAMSSRDRLPTNFILIVSNAGGIGYRGHKQIELLSSNCLDHDGSGRNRAGAQIRYRVAGPQGCVLLRLNRRLDVAVHQIQVRPAASIKVNAHVCRGRRAGSSWLYLARNPAYIPTLCTT